MVGLALQFGGSLLGVLGLVAMCRWLGFGGPPHLSDAAEAMRLARHAEGGFVAVAVALDRHGRAALLRDAAGRVMLLAPHGAHFAGRLLGERTRSLLSSDGSLTVEVSEGAGLSAQLELGENTLGWGRLIDELG